MFCTRNIQESLKTRKPVLLTKTFRATFGPAIETPSPKKRGNFILNQYDRVWNFLVRAFENSFEVIFQMCIRRK